MLPSSASVAAPLHVNTQHRQCRLIPHEMIFTANLYTGAIAFSTNHLTDTDKTTHNLYQQTVDMSLAVVIVLMQL